MGQRTQMLVRVNVTDENNNKFSKTNIYHYQWGGYSKRMFYSIMSAYTLSATLATCGISKADKDIIEDLKITDLENAKAHSMVIAKLLDENFKLQLNNSNTSKEYRNIEEIQNAEKIKGDYNDGLIAIEINFKGKKERFSFDITEGEFLVSYFATDSNKSCVRNTIESTLDYWDTEQLYLKEVNATELMNEWELDKDFIKKYNDFENAFVDGTTSIKCFSCDYIEKLKALTDNIKNSLTAVDFKKINDGTIKPKIKYAQNLLLKDGILEYDNDWLELWATLNAFIGAEKISKEEVLNAIAV